MKPSAKRHQNILGLSEGEIPDQEMNIPEESTRVNTGGHGCTPEKDRKGGCGRKNRLDPVTGIRKFSPRCEL